MIKQLGACVKRFGSATLRVVVHTLCFPAVPRPGGRDRTRQVGSRCANPKLSCVNNSTSREPTWDAPVENKSSLIRSHEKGFSINQGPLSVSPMVCSTFFQQMARLLVPPTPSSCSKLCSKPCKKYRLERMNWIITLTTWGGRHSSPGFSVIVISFVRGKAGYIMTLHWAQTHGTGR